MALIAVGSAKGGAGASTVALALAGAWRPGTAKPLLVEADPGGGDLLVNFQLEDGPGLVSLASAARRSGLDAALVAAHARPLHRGARVVPAPVSAERTGAVLDLLAPLWAEADLDGEYVVADVGRRLDVLSGRELLARADVAVMVSGGSAAALAHTSHAIRKVEGQLKAVLVAVSGHSEHSREEIAAALGVEAVVMVPRDEVSAAVLRGEPEPKRRRGERGTYELMRHAVLLGDALLPYLPLLASPPDPAPVEPPRGRVDLVGAVQRGN